MADERYVPLEDKESNYHVCREELLRHVPIPAERVHCINPSLPLAECAQEYQVPPPVLRVESGSDCE